MWPVQDIRPAWHFTHHRLLVLATAPESGMSHVDFLICSKRDILPSQAERHSPQVVHDQKWEGLSPAPHDSMFCCPVIIYRSLSHAMNDGPLDAEIMKLDLDARAPSLDVPSREENLRLWVSGRWKQNPASETCVRTMSQRSLPRKCSAGLGKPSHEGPDRSEEAGTEIIEAATDHEACMPGPGVLFLGALEEAVQDVLAHHDACQRVGSEIRCSLMRALSLKPSVCRRTGLDSCSRGRAPGVSPWRLEQSAFENC
jgi:hypothetical protein